MNEQPTPQEARAYLIGWTMSATIGHLAQSLPVKQLPKDVLDKLIMEAMSFIFKEMKASPIEYNEYMKVV